MSSDTSDTTDVPSAAEPAVDVAPEDSRLAERDVSRTVVECSEDPVHQLHQ